jgi:hypothetical protein
VRRFHGWLGSADVPETQVTYTDGAAAVLLTLTNSISQAVTVVVEKRYSGARQTTAISPSEKLEQRWLLESSRGCLQSIFRQPVFRQLAEMT